MGRFRQTGGGRVSGLGAASWPFAHIDVTRDALTLELIGVKHMLPRDDVVTVKTVGPNWAPPGLHGIRIIHHAIGSPKKLVFWSFNRYALLRALEDAGYSIGSD